MARDGGTSGSTQTSHNVNHSIGEASFLDQLGHTNSSQRSPFGWFEDDGVSGGECRPEFPGHHPEREVPWDDLTHDAKPSENLISSFTGLGRCRSVELTVRYGCKLAWLR